MPVTCELPELIDETEAAKLLGLERQTLTNWRCTHRVCLPFVKVGRTVRYRKSDLLEFVNENTIKPMATA